MIAYLEGMILEKNTESLVLKTGGVGFFVEIPVSTYYELPEKGQSVSLYIQTLIRDDAVRLFGFYRKQEKEMFNLLIGIPRVGPKLALNVLSGMELGQLRKAMISEDIHALASIPGLGRKSAERIVFEIRRKKDLLKLFSDTVDLESQEDSTKKEIREVVSMLQNLGYKQHMAEQAVKKALSEIKSDVSLDRLIKASLRILSGRV